MTGQEVEGFPIIRVRADEIAYSGRGHYGGGGGAPSVSVYMRIPAVAHRQVMQRISQR